ncbi:MAG: MCE family protein [Candidatus Cloacimonetes bacterium]|nr:MCE family protein [Candidatus Cloacimonadota bacterium]
MITKSQKIRLGIFVFVAVALLLILLSLVIGSKFLEKRDIYYIAYKDVSVSGLDIGSAVKYHGIRVGRIEELKVDTEDITRVIVKISVKEKTPIKSDVKAVISAVGITGLKLIELVGGTTEAETLKPNSFIESGPSVFEEITGKAEIISEKLEVVLNNLAEITKEANQRKVEKILTNINILLSENREPITNTLSNLDSISFYAIQFTKSASEAAEKLNTILHSEELQNLLANSEEFSSKLAKVDISTTIEELNNAIKQANDAFLHIDRTVLKSRSDILETLEILKETVDYLNEFSRDISEDPSILLRPTKK